MGLLLLLVAQIQRLAILMRWQFAKMVVAYCLHVPMILLVIMIFRRFAPIIPFVLTRVVQMQRLATLMQTQVAPMSHVYSLAVQI